MKNPLSKFKLTSSNKWIGTSAICNHLKCCSVHFSFGPAPSRCGPGTCNTVNLVQMLLYCIDLPATIKQSCRSKMHSNHFDNSHTSLLTMLCCYFANFCANQGSFKWCVLRVRCFCICAHTLFVSESHHSMKSVLYRYHGYDGNTSEEHPSIIAFADKSMLGRKNHNELAVLKQPLNVPPIICGHLAVTMLCPSNYVWFSNGMPNGASEGNQYLGSSSRSVGDILDPKPLQCAGSWPYHIMTFSLRRRQPFDTESGLCPEKQSKLAALNLELRHIHCRHNKKQTKRCTPSLAYAWKIRHLCRDFKVYMDVLHLWGPSQIQCFGPVINLNHLILTVTLKGNHCLLHLECYFL